ncbi:MAG: nicotinate-nucleotide adenylyltransferase [Bacteroidales bacterium]|nr:nicotinate-nucleotide adenylyltransferase [Bacteroidales bacterium]
MKIGLYFGSFNPIHIGHLAIANYMIEFSDLEQIWFVVTPQSPDKKQASLLPDYQRYELVYRAIEDFQYFRVSNIEFTLPKPSYTIDSLVHIGEKFPEHTFSLIMGADNLVTINKWKNAEIILKDYNIYVYPRPHIIIEEYLNYSTIKIVEAPLMEISSSFIREAIKKGKNLKAFVPLKTWNYIEEMNFYK